MSGRAFATQSQECGKLEGSVSTHHNSRVTKASYETMCHGPHLHTVRVNQFELGIDKSFLVRKHKHELALFAVRLQYSHSEFVSFLRKSTVFQHTVPDGLAKEMVHGR